VVIKLEVKYKHFTMLHLDFI